MKFILGYVGKSQVYPELNPNQTATLTYLKKLTKDNQIQYVQKKAHENLMNVKLILQKNLERNIFAFRISSTIIPHG